jgi:hypothetical protein
MQITKTKTYDNIFSISELKEDLNIDESDLTYNGQLKRYLRSAVDIAEQHIQDDIVPSVCVLEENSYLTNFVYINYPIYTTNVKVTSIQISYGFGSGNTLTTLDPASYAIEKFNNYTNIIFKGSCSGTRLLINYTSGMPVISESIKRAVYLKVGELFDIDRNNYVSNQIQKSNSFERLLSPFINALY